MTSKTFKSAVSAGHLNIHDSKRGLINVSISRNRAILEMIDLNTETAPALALAILEAAGYGEEVVTDGSPDGHVQVAKYYLYEGVKAHAIITAEAKEQAELEAEALELFNTLQVEIHGIHGPDWVNATEFLSDETKRKWLAVARRAREMRAEK